MDFKIGQRWVSHTEAALGLGLVAEVSGRRVTISFPAAAEERTYATDNAPLARVRYQVGETLQTHEEAELEVVEATESDGLVFYTVKNEAGELKELSELKLSPFAQFTTPQQRLFAGRFDKNPAFQLRVETLGHLAHLQQSPVQGLLGSRTSHLAHQIYIASEVARRYAPRVLLADEVGLGKTIEAGMILHAQLHTARAQRVLVVVPDTLVHQWLVEMLRRFNLHFAIFDQSRYEALLASESDYELDENDNPVLMQEGDQNPFETEQLVLCSLDFLTRNAEARAHAEEAGWDLMVVDEAHHLRWSPDDVSPEYACVELLAAQTKGLLLLTATPEQVGLESHFARLRLLDPARFHDLETFRREEANYGELNTLVQDILHHEGHLESSQLDRLEPYLKEEVWQLRDNPDQFDVHELVSRLLDRHGTGRVLFRNTRAAIQGFPERQVEATPLPLPGLYESEEQRLGEAGLTPEATVLEDDWLAEDPRVAWLESTLTSLKPAKVLVICARAETAVALERHLQLRAGIRSAAFHEGLTIVERDRAAAYFAETEQGAQALVCSEIGSEGRNFQFAHHLVLFDLPRNPDLLEQRIGRLDRIGQSATIEIHVPYLENSSQEVLYRWYQDGLNAFTHSCVVGVAVKDALREQLDAQLARPEPAGMSALLTQTAELTRQLHAALEAGRDPLLEINSCNRPKAQVLIEQIEEEENTAGLQTFMEGAYGQYGVDYEDHSENAWILRPSEHMLTGYFPGLPEEGVTVTYDRDLALVREDMTFLSWEHPMVVETLDMIATTELGNAALATISVKGVQPGTVLLETVFTVHCPAPKALQLSRFLPLRPVRLLMDAKGRDISHVMPHAKLNELCQDIKRRTAQAIVPQVREEVERMIAAAQGQAREQLPGIQAGARETMETSLGEEVSRLRALQQVNPAIRDEEIQFLEAQIKDSAEAIANASLELQALRVVIST
ncbi:RNA polymerase-associated protein RapA [Hydrocarboniclastica marina]|uniref:RNA polymerase-associated protein RapA n=1 Tax=Hydrocarboniclastica marina TaxID=2259620 RepID=A0A4P7XM14_9ALTE|nr:RNA polymerase-associated protein RapA [Hydrocarboniclastica marina]MAM00377.1 RNA polymerase-associated protein RapA [Alteromonadaceae bacterium]QCF28035.1 RNA polymerase-associated protein RapA [Hydrocarboniclastica marina]|tara:strand:+ start:1327 stop:4203 length:2877 start_codon:yes stop_codon:yes gene_type:complete